MLQFDLQFYEELTVAQVKTVKFISGAFFGQQVSLFTTADKNSFVEIHINVSHYGKFCDIIWQNRPGPHVYNYTHVLKGGES